MRYGLLLSHPTYPWFYRLSNLEVYSTIHPNSIENGEDLLAPPWRCLQVVTIFLEDFVIGASQGFFLGEDRLDGEFSFSFPFLCSSFNCLCSLTHFPPPFLAYCCLYFSSLLSLLVSFEIDRCFGSLFLVSSSWRSVANDYMHLSFFFWVMKDLCCGMNETFWPRMRLRLIKKRSEAVNRNLLRQCLQLGFY